MLVAQQKGDDSSGGNIIRMIPAAKNTMVVINADHELQKIHLCGGGKYRLHAKTRLEPEYYSVMHDSTSKGGFMNSQKMVFADGNDYLVTCRHLDNTFVLYHLSALTRSQSVAFHLVPHSIFCDTYNE